jgi:hypothetical protein
MVAFEPQMGKRIPKINWCRLSLGHAVPTALDWGFVVDICSVVPAVSGRTRILAPVRILPEFKGVSSRQGLP